MNQEYVAGITAVFAELRQLLGDRPNVMVHVNNLEAACLTGKSFKYVRAPRREGKTARYIDRATQYLVAHPGPHRQVDICRKCKIPLGSTVPVFASKRFKKIESGLIILHPDYVVPEKFIPQYEHQDAIVEILRKLQPCKTTQIASALGVSYKVARKELESGFFHASPDGYWLPLKPDEPDDASF